MGLIVFGDTAFRDRGLYGMGIAGYTGAQGYTPYERPTAVGARYFVAEEFSEYDKQTDKQIPIAQGNKWDGGRPAYRQRVYAAAKKGGKHLGFSKEDVEGLKPKKGA